MLLSNVFSDMFSDMFPASMVGRVEPSTRAHGLMSCDVQEFDDHYVIDMELAGFRKEDIKAELKDGYLTIKAERNSNRDRKDENGRMLRSERFMGTCQRTFYVGEAIEKENVSAAFEDGVLRLSIPRIVETPKIEESHRIAIQ